MAATARPRAVSVKRVIRSVESLTGRIRAIPSSSINTPTIETTQEFMVVRTDDPEARTYVFASQELAETAIDLSQSSQDYHVEVRDVHRICMPWRPDRADP